MSRQNTRIIVPLILLVVVGIALRSLFILHPLQGDEYNSLLEAADAGDKLNGWLYYWILGMWMKLGGSDWWYRIPSIAIGAAGIPIAYWTGRALDKERVGLVFAGLTAVSPFNVELSLRIRHYSLFLTASMLMVLAGLIFLRRRQPGWLRWFLLLGASLVVTLSHVFGVVLALAVGIYLYVAVGAWPSRQRNRLFAAVLPLLISFGLVLHPQIRSLAWRWLQESVGALSRVEYQGSRGLGVVQFVKVGLALYVFTLGYDVYPLTWFVTVPAAIASVMAVLFGIRRLWRDSVLGLLLSVLSLLVVVFVVFDSLAPPFSETAGPRHVAMAWPAYALLLSEGMSGFRRRYLSVALVLISLAGVGLNYVDAWDYGLSGPDWNYAAALAEPQHGEPSLLLYDGRSDAGTARYFPQDLSRQNIWSYLRDPGGTREVDRVVFVSNDYKPGNRETISQALNLVLSRGFTCLERAYVDYPFFEYVLARGQGADSCISLSTPLDIYGLEFRDLSLPITLNVEGVEVHVVGAFVSSPAAENRTRRLALDQDVHVHRILLVSNCLETGDLEDGELVAELVVEGLNGSTDRYPIRLGRETAGWATACSESAPCTTVHRWRKRAALVGQRSYPGAWREFMAGLHACWIDLKEAEPVDRISVDYAADSGELYVWALAIP